MLKQTHQKLPKLKSKKKNITKLNSTIQESSIKKSTETDNDFIITASFTAHNFSDFFEK